MVIRTLAEADAALRPYVPLVAQLTGHHTTLERIEPLMARLGNPEQRLKVIHIAGTSGKTSTAYYMSALLVAAGKKVGLTVSPHVDAVTERIQINGQALSEADFCHEMGEFLEIVQQLPMAPSYFELLYAFAIWVFEKRQVDYAVIETGLGGLFDATNVARRPDKVCIITDIGLDHTHILGETLSEIAVQKIGIAHTGNQVFSFEQKPDVMRVFEDYIRQQKADLHITTEGHEHQLFGDELDTMPAYQQRNWLLAYVTNKYLQNRDKLPSLASQALHGTQGIKIPARLEIKQHLGKTIVMDGAHNEQKMTAFVDSFRQLYPAVRPVVMLALKESKDYRQVVPVVAKLTDHVILTTFNTTQDLPTRSSDPAKLAKAFAASNLKTIEVIKDQRVAFQALLKAPAKTAVITGSFYLLSQVRHNEGLA